MNTRKKVLFVITKSNWGGAQRYVYDIATSLPTSEYEVAVACGGNGLLVSKLREKNIPVHTVESFQRDISIAKEFSSIGELWKLYKTIKPDIVHLNSSKAGGIGALTARFARVPRIIFTVHGWPFWEPRTIVQKSLIAFFSWLTVVCTHTTICISQFDVAIGKRMPWVKRKIRLIRNGITPFEPLARDVARLKLCNQQILDEHKNDIWVLTNAELTKNKNHSAGIDAVCAHNNSSPTKKIFYVCMGDGELREELETYIKKNNAEQYVALLGFIPDGYQYYNAFDIFLLPSLKEGVPYVLLEAGVAGLACIASNVGGIPEVITDGKSGFLVPPQNTEGLKKALQNLCENENVRTAFGTQLHTNVIEHYSKETMLAQTLSEYQTHKHLSTNGRELASIE